MNQINWKTINAGTRLHTDGLTSKTGGFLSNSIPSRLEQIVSKFAPITLQEMDSVALLDRIDTKFVLSDAQLGLTLVNLCDDYRILSVQGQRLNHYHTLYFDTSDFELYNLHVNGRGDRYKVRSREYTDSKLSFLEVKHKTGKDRTIKDRLSTRQPLVSLSIEAESWLEKILPYASSELEPKLKNTFTRITLVNKYQVERVTLDVDLAFFTDWKQIKMTGIAIAEVKLDSRNQVSPFLTQMRKLHIRPQGFSKYCIGVSLLYDQVKKNQLKPGLLAIKKINHEVYDERF
ncbi:MAG: polyphosphate polymerase domain-containing protein [Anaerolineae bacterium]|nr:polyphosphate polymerase domain-containing protein [Anaerolineae bacterium]